MAAALGDTFRLADTSVNSHLFAIIPRPEAHPSGIVTANLTSWCADKDQSCVVEPGEHLQITRRSCVDYRPMRTRLITLAEYDRAVRSGDVVPQPPVSVELLRRTLEGAAKSPHIPLGSRQILVDQGLIDGD